MEELMKLVSEYGVPALILSLIIIFLIGVLKYFKLFDKIPKDWRKAIFSVLGLAFSFGTAALYYVIFKNPFTNYVWFSLGTYALVTVVYALYENLGARALLKLFGNFVVSKVANEQVKEAVKKLTDSIPEETKK